MIFKVDEFYIEEIINDNVASNDATQYINELLGIEDLSEESFSNRNDNFPSIRLVEKLGGIKVKTFKLFEHNDLAIFTYHIRRLK